MTFKPFSFAKRSEESKDRATYIQGVQRSLYASMLSDYEPSTAARLAWCLVKSVRTSQREHASSLAHVGTFDVDTLSGLRSVVVRCAASEKNKASKLRSELLSDIRCMLDGFIDRSGVASSSPAPKAPMTPKTPQRAAPARASWSTNDDARMATCLALSRTGLVGEALDEAMRLAGFPDEEGAGDGEEASDE